MPIWLSAVAAFCGVEDAALGELDAASTRVPLHAGETLFRRGDPSDALFVVESGAFALESAAAMRSRRRARISAGECVGELAILTDRPRSATVVAVEDSVAIRVPRTACRRVMDAFPAARDRLLALAARRRPSVYLAANPLFAGIDAAALDALDEAATWVGVDGGTTLVRQGDASDALYVLVRGTLHVVVDDADGAAHSVEYLEAGALVGELGVLLDQPRSATIRAVRDSELLHLPRTAFLQLLEAEPALGAALARPDGTTLLPFPRIFIVAER